MQLVLEDIRLEAVQTAALALADKPVEECSAHYINVERNVHFAAYGGSCQHIVYNVVLVDAENRLRQRSLDGVNAAAVNAGDVRAALLVGVNYRAHIHIRNDVAVRHYNVLGVAFADKLGSARKRLKSAAVNAGALSAVRRKNMQTARLARQIPFRAHAEVVHQRIVILLCDNADLCNARIYHSRQRKVYQTVLAAERNACHRSRLSQFGKGLLVHISKDQTQNFSHTCHIKRSSYIIYP